MARRFTVIVWICIASAVWLAVAGERSSWAPPAGSPLARREHPRLLLTRDSLPGIRQKLGGPFRTEYQEFVRFVSDSAFEDSKRGRKQGASEDLRNIAFIHVVGPVPGIDYGGRSREAYLARARELLAGELGRSRRKNDTLPYAYDWLYGELTDDDRRRAVALFRQLEHGEGGNPLNGADIFTRVRHVAAGLAFFGDGIDDGAAEAMVRRYEVLVSHKDTGLLDAGSFLAGDDGGWGQGLSYSTNRGVMLRLLETMEAWRTSNGYTREAVFGADNARALRYYPVWVAYHILPDARSSPKAAGGRVYRLYRTHHMESGVAAHDWSSLDGNLAALRLYKSIAPDTASLAQWLIEERTDGIQNTGIEGREWAVLCNFVLGEKGIAAKSPVALGLPLTKTFAGLGWVVMRTGWESTGDSMVTLTAAPWSRAAGTYTNRDQGTFTIDRRGPLVVNSGVSIHHPYSNSTWSGNTVLFVEPDAPVDRAGYPDRGGQRVLFPLLTRVSQLVPGAPHDIGGIKRQWVADPVSGRDVDYVFADVTRAYNGPANADGRNSLKVRSFTRQFAYFRPTRPGESDRIVVFDRTESTDPGCEKRWLLHPSGTPEVTGIERMEREGRWSYGGAGLITTTNRDDGSSGRLFVHVLLPASRQVVKIGGPGHEFEDPYGNNDAVAFQPGKSQYMGTYRIEVIPEARSTKDLFLHVLEATDADVSASTPTARLEGTGLVGVRVGQRIVAFGLEESPVEVGELVIDQPGTYKLLLCDLEPAAKYEVGDSGRWAASPAGTIYLELRPSRPGSKVVIKALP